MDDEQLREIHERIARLQAAHEQIIATQTQAQAKQEAIVAALARLEQLLLASATRDDAPMLH